MTLKKIPTTNIHGRFPACDWATKHYWSHWLSYILFLLLFVLCLIEVAHKFPIKSLTICAFKCSRPFLVACARSWNPRKVAGYTHTHTQKQGKDPRIQFKDCSNKNTGERAGRQSWISILVFDGGGYDVPVAINNTQKAKRPPLGKTEHANAGTRKLWWAVGVD